MNLLVKTIMDLMSLYTLTIYTINMNNLSPPHKNIYILPAS